MMMEFTYTEELENLYDQIIKKKVRPEFGNPLHIKLVKYLTKKSEFAEWCKDEGIDLYTVIITFADDEVVEDAEYEVYAKNLDEARDYATIEFEDEDGEDLDIVDVMVI